MRIIHIVFGCALWSLSAIGGAVQGQSSAEASYNGGMHIGRLIWSAAHCKGEVSAAIIQSVELFRDLNPDAFSLGVRLGDGEMRRADTKHGRVIACATMIMLYGPGGLRRSSPSR